MTKMVERIEMKDIFLLDAQIVVWKGRSEVLKIIIYVSILVYVILTLLPLRLTNI